jgi:hypothetical protein
MLCSQKVAVKFQCCWDVVWVLEHEHNEDKTQAIYFSDRLSPLLWLILGWMDGISSNMESAHRNDWSHCLQNIHKFYSQFKIEHLSANVELILHKALNRSVMTCMPHLGICGRHVSLKIVVCVEHYSLHDWKFSKVHTGLKFAHGFQPSLYIWLCNKIVQTARRRDMKSWEWTCLQRRTRQSQT